LQIEMVTAVRRVSENRRVASNSTPRVGVADHDPRFRRAEVAGQRRVRSRPANVGRRGAGWYGLSLGVVATFQGGHYFAVMPRLKRVNHTMMVEPRTIGSAETITGKIPEYHVQLGIHYFVPRTGSRPEPMESILASMRHLAEEVRPHFIDSSSPAIFGASPGPGPRVAPTDS